MTAGQDAAGATRAAETAVVAMWQALNRADWDTAAALVAEDVVITMPDSGRVLRGRAAFRSFNADYPGRTRCTVLGVHTAPDGTVVSRVEAVNDRLGRFWCVGFYRSAGDVVAEGLEYWVTEDRG